MKLRIEGEIKVQMENHFYDNSLMWWWVLSWIWKLFADYDAEIPAHGDAMEQELVQLRRERRVMV